MANTPVGAPTSISTEFGRHPPGPVRPSGPNWTQPGWVQIGSSRHGSHGASLSAESSIHAPRQLRLSFTEGWAIGESLKCSNKVVDLLLPQFATVQRSYTHYHKVDGIVSGPLLLRLYYLNGGSRKWLVSCVQTPGFPILIVPISLLILRAKSKPIYFVLLESNLLLSIALMGILLGVINFLYSQRLSYLPVSTAPEHSVGIYCRVVKRKFMAYIVN
ncbi:hypothetical protein Syun_003790 [Stephania yunnanensis]|uniref:Uncharacterized protein n=1 Tax=Stephania yunnanensis TaxID=152371 RepID=A0AAP0L391_9MAGN